VTREPLWAVNKAVAVPYVQMPFLLSPAYWVPRMTISLWDRLLLMLMEEVT
jgi:hypothetical protein